MARGRRLKRISEVLFRIHRGLGLRIAERRGLHVYERSRRRREKHIPTREEWAAAFGDEAVRDEEFLAREYALSQYRLHLIQRVAAEGGLNYVVPLVRWKGREKLEQLLKEGRPVVLTTWHAGPTIGIWAGLSAMPIRLMRVQETRWDAAPSGWKILITHGPRGGGPILKQCLKHLRSGGWTANPFDTFTFEPAHLRLKCLGRSVRIPRGIAALAEMSGAALIPVAARWTGDGRGIEVEVQDPIDTARRAGETDGDYERRVLEATVSRMEAYLRESPHELNRMRLRFLLNQPPWPSSADNAHHAP